MTYEFSGISTEQYEDIKEFMEYQDNGLIIETVPFTVELEDKEVELYLYIEDLDMAEFDTVTDHIVSIGVIPSFDSLSKDSQESILDQFMPEDRDKMLEDKESLLFDIFLYGFHLGLRSETVKQEDAEKTVESAIAVRRAVSGLIGFELDRYMNRIGNTGWDFLDDYCNDKDLLQMALARHEQLTTA